MFSFISNIVSTRHRLVALAKIEFISMVIFSSCRYSGWHGGGHGSAGSETPLIYWCQVIRAVGARGGGLGGRSDSFTNPRWLGEITTNRFTRRAVAYHWRLGLYPLQKKHCIYVCCDSRLFILTNNPSRIACTMDKIWYVSFLLQVKTLLSDINP